MEHIAIDLGGKESQICVRAVDGQILEERRHSTGRLRAYLRTRPTSRVVIETSAESFAIADAALEAGHQVRVVPSALVRSLGVGQRGLKTDRRDAQLLSEVSCRIDLPSVHIPSAESRRRKSLCGMREALVSARTQLINTVWGWMRGQVRRPRSGGAKTFPQRVREHFARHSATPLPSFVERQLTAIDELSRQLYDAGLELAELSKQDPTCQRLMTVPGVGPVTAIRYVAALDDVSRFSRAHAVESYIGLVPGEDSSSDRQRRTSITKAGTPQLRRMLTQAAWVALIKAPNEPMVQWARSVEQRRGKKVAVIALARKIAGMLYAIWRDGSEYRSDHR